MNARQKGNLLFALFADIRGFRIFESTRQGHIWKGHSLQGEADEKALCNQDFEERGHHTKGTTCLFTSFDFCY